MLQNTKLRLQEVIKETGMKIWDLGRRHAGEWMPGAALVQ